LKHTRRGWHKFFNFVCFEVGVGSKVSFWHDHWCRDRPLKLFYLALFNIARCKDAWVVDNMFFQEGIIQCNVIFTQHVQDWKMELVLSFLEWLYSFHLRHGHEYRLGWSPSKRDKFEVKSFYKVLTTQDGPSFLWKSIWRVKAPLRVDFCVDSSFRKNFDTW